MNNFEFFSLIFLLLEERWEECKDENLAYFLSEMNPYLFTNIGSADPAVYAEFLDFMKDKTLGEDNGFSLVNSYLDTVTFYPNLKDFLKDVDQEIWNDAVQQLMSQPHKGEETKSKD